MFKVCQTEKSQRRQRLIEDTFFKLLEKNRYENITITKICETVPMPRKSFYRYFETKEDVLDALIQHNLATYSGFTKNSKPIVKNIREEFEQFYTYWLDKKYFLDVLARNNLLPKILEISTSFPVFELVSMEKYLPQDDEWTRRKIVKFTIFGLISEVLGWYQEGFKTSIKDMANATYRIITKPLFPFDEIVK